MTAEMRRLLALVSLNGKAKELHDEFQAEGQLEIAALMRQIGDQIALAVGMLVKEQAERKAAEAQS